jgi:hypothetical protein
MANVCEDWIPGTFWRKAYNIGGGKKWRLTLWQMYDLYLDHLGLDYRRIFDPRDLGIYNFHGQWFTDSDELNEITNFRYLDPEEFFQKEMRDIRMVRRMPLIKRFVPDDQKMKQLVDAVSTEHGGTQWMFDNNQEEWIISFFGSCEERDQLKSWKEGCERYDLSRTPTYLDHGYDEAKPTGELDLRDIQDAAEFRDGVYLSTSMTRGDLYTPLQRKCHIGHEFDATPT